MTVGETEQAAPLEATGVPPGVGLVSVIVPHLDDYDNLDTCLSLLQAQSFQAIGRKSSSSTTAAWRTRRGAPHRRVARPSD